MGSEPSKAARTEVRCCSSTNILPKPQHIQMEEAHVHVLDQSGVAGNHNRAAVSDVSQHGTVPPPKAVWAGM